MERRRTQDGASEYAIMDDAHEMAPESFESPAPTLQPSPINKSKTRSLSDSNSTPSKLSPSPYISESANRISKDDSSINTTKESPATPTTPSRPLFAPRHLSLNMPARQFTPPPAAASNAFARPAAPLSPQLDHSQIYATPANVLPRRSRGLDFSRAATSLHHSTLAEQSSPDSSPTMGGRAMAIPGRRADGTGPEQTSSSLWSMMGNQEKMAISGSLGSNHAMVSESSSSDDDHDMDEDMDDTYVMTPQVRKTTSIGHPGMSGPFGSPASNSFTNFQQRRPRKNHKKDRGPYGLGFHSINNSSSRSPPTTANARRESISWQANKLRISGNDGEEKGRGSSEGDGMSSDGQKGVVRRAVTRRGNLLPKTKTFARIRAVLAEESAPAEAECKREAEVVKQVYDNDEVCPPPQHPSAAATALSSPNQESMDYHPEEDTMGDLAVGLSSSFKHQAIRNSKGTKFWDTFSETSSVGGNRTTPPPPNHAFPRGSSGSMSEDVSMDSPSANGVGFPLNLNQTPRADSRGSESMQPLQGYGPQPPSAAEITRRINNKRRRDDDFDPNIFKRRAVSPGMSVQGSPVVQSPMQRDVAPWGSRPGSNGDKGGNNTPSESGSAGTPGNASTAPGGRHNSKGRVGFQGMSDTSDGVMRMSIE